MADYSETTTRFEDSFEYIASFFGGDVELIDTFNKICEDMLSLDGGLAIRHNSSIIGMAKGKQYYRFYLSCKDGRFFIKYKHSMKKELFSPSDIQRYFLKNRESYEFFSRKEEQLVRSDTKSRALTNGKKKPIDLNEDWGTIRARAKQSLEKGYEQASYKVVYNTYNSILTVLEQAAENYLPPSKAEILKKRLLTNSPETLRSLADDYYVSHERIRQWQNNSWRRLSTGIYMYAGLVGCRESLKNILMDIPSEMLISTIKSITAINKPIGEWLYMIVAEDNQN